MSQPNLRIVSDALDTEPGTQFGPQGPSAVAEVRDVDPNRPILMALCQGAPIRLTPQELDLVALLNNARNYCYLIDPNRELDEVRPAEWILEHVLVRYGIDGAAQGSRATTVASVARKYLVPFAVEAAWAKPDHLQGACHFRLQEAEVLPRMLAGREPLPAATVAGEQLKGRPALSCLHLDLVDAALVTEGGAPALEAAIAARDVAVYSDVRAGIPLVRPADLRAAHLLRELTEPHGLQTNSARNVLRELTGAFQRAKRAGANMVSDFEIAALEPRTPDRMRVPKPRHTYTSLAEIKLLSGHLPLIAQVVIWVERLLGLRISESFGPLVSDFRRDETGRGWLMVARQGGLSMTIRDQDTGALHTVAHKNGTKTRAGTRDIPLPHLLADLLETLIAVFHTDPHTGAVRSSARLVPGIGKDDASGQSTFRDRLKRAQTEVGLTLRPHALRGALITDLKEAGISKRTRYAYAGHEIDNADIQSRSYDQGVSKKKLLKVAGTLDKLLANELADLGPTGLVCPTTLREQWGRGTRNGALAEHIKTQLLDLGWWIVETDATRGQCLKTKAIAERLDMKSSHVKRLLVSGELPGFKEPWGSREVWCAWEADVEAYRAARGRTLGDIARETGWTYHQLWSLTEELGLGPRDRGHREAIRLTEHDEDQLIAAIDQREQATVGSLTLSEAAERLHLEVDDVEVLVRYRYVDLMEHVRKGLPRRVSEDSVERLIEAREAWSITETPAVGTLTLLQAAKALACDRRHVPPLIKAGILREATTGTRRLVTRDSVERHAGRVSDSASEKASVTKD